MSTIAFSKEEKEIIVHKVKRYFSEELDQDLGQFDAEVLLDFFASDIGPYLYNRGLSDARAILESKLEHIDEALYEIEMPTEFIR